MKSTIYILSIIILCLVRVEAQIDSAQIMSPVDTSIVVDSLQPNQDTLTSGYTTFGQDTLPGFNGSARIIGENDYPLSKDAIDKIINYGCIDSNWTNVKLNQLHLYGEAYLKYEDVEINAGYIYIDFTKKLAKAYKNIPNGKLNDQYPTFRDPTMEAKYEELAYNFNTNKAFVKQLQTEQSEFFVLGAKSKYISAENDTVYNEAKFYNEDAIITTCNHNPPHFGIRTKKMKFIPEKIAVVGPSQLEIAGVPTPFVLPFGFFPLIQGESSGLIFPEYDYNAELGFNLRNLGYYFPINDYMDLTVTGDIYSRGSHAVRLETDFKKRYKYSGYARLGYSQFFRENNDGNIDREPAYNLEIRRTQDPKAHPYRTIGGSINIQTNQYDRRNNNDAGNVLNNKLSSEFNYTYRWPDSPFKFSAGLSHRQDNNLNVINLTLPNASLNMNTIQPFKRKNQVGGEKWYERINLGYGADLKNYVQASDTTLFTNQTLQDIQTGFAHDVDLSTNGRFLKYFTVSPSINYDEIYYLKTNERLLDPTLLIDENVIGEDSDGVEIIERDTTFGQVIDTSFIDPQVFRKLTTSVRINTNIFATKTFSRGLLRGVRHILKPNVTFSYSPDSRDRYQEVVYTDTRDDVRDSITYDPFPRGIFNPSLSGEQKAIRWGMSHVFEGKYYSKKDSSEKKFKIFNQITMSGGYNFAADSLNWDDISINGNTPVIKGLTNFIFNSTWTPYELRDGSTSKRNVLLADNDKPILQIRTFSMGFNTGLSFTQIKDIFMGKGKSEAPIQVGADGKPIKYKSFSSILDKFRITHNLRFNYDQAPNDMDSLRMSTHSIAFSGGIPLSENWDVTISNFDYNFLSKRFVYPAFTFSRKLHCWNMRFSWYPRRDVYSFFIGVNSNQLNFIKYDTNTGGANQFF